MLDKLKELGFRDATAAGISIGIDDMIIPKEKDEVIDDARKQIAEVEKQYRKGIITHGERYNKIIDIWTHTHRPDLQRACSAASSTTSGKQRVQPRLHDGGLRRPRQPAAGPPARRHARPDGQALRRDHRAPDLWPTSARA